VEDYVQKLVEEGLSESQIAVISPYNAQVPREIEIQIEMEIEIEIGIGIGIGMEIEIEIGIGR
tara:strand:- start:351 stop:539 length:189 start_codon:yes stop_codon:yes gene_type:complete